MLRKKGFLPLIFLICLAQRPLYDIRDLEVLEANGNHQEFFNHAKDIRPGKRDQHWREMVVNMAESWALKMVNSQRVSLEQYKKIEDLVLWPELKKNDLFLTRRHKIGMNYFTACYQKNSEGPSCRKALLSFWSRSDKRPEWGIELMGLMRKQDSVPLDRLWELASPAVNHELSEFFCQRSQVRGLVIEKLIQQAQIHPYKKLKEETIKLIHPLCWKAIRPQLVHFLETPFVANRRSAIKLLLARPKSRGKGETDWLYTLYLLSDPVKGDVFNESWGVLASLRDDHVRRKGVLERLKEMDPFPDDSFGVPDRKKRLTLIRQFQLHFPEYLDLYAQKCFDFVTGNKNFSNGNPTVQCRGFVESARGKSLMRSHLEARLVELFQFSKRP